MTCIKLFFLPICNICFFLYINFLFYVYCLCLPNGNGRIQITFKFHEVLFSVKLCLINYNFLIHAENMMLNLYEQSMLIILKPCFLALNEIFDI